MHSYTIYVRCGGLSPFHDIVVVKDGFCWGACYFTALWSLWHRMWLVSFLFLVLIFGVNFAGWFLSFEHMGFGVLTIWCAITLGLFGNDLRCWNLEQRGFAFSGLVVEKTVELALAKYYEQSFKTSENSLFNESQP